MIFSPNQTPSRSKQPLPHNTAATIRGRHRALRGFAFATPAPVLGPEPASGRAGGPTARRLFREQDA